MVKEISAKCTTIFQLQCNRLSKQGYLIWSRQILYWIKEWQSEEHMESENFLLTELTAWIVHSMQNKTIRAAEFIQSGKTIEIQEHLLKIHQRLICLAQNTKFSRSWHWRYCIGKVFKIGNSIISNQNKWSLNHLEYIYNWQQKVDQV